MIDLHLHTTCSDGSLKPKELVDKVSARGIKAIAITDHDEICGCAEAVEYAKGKNITVIPGVELSIDYPLQGKNHLHLLGLFIDVHNELLNNALERLRAARRSRAKRIVEKLKQIGYDLTYEELSKSAGDGSIGRPHVAALLRQKGIVKQEAEAFRYFLGRGGPAYVPKEKMDLNSAIEVIHKAKGLAMLAHPISLGYKTYELLGKEILKWQGLGLDGIEAYYSRHDRYLTDWLLAFARQHGLAVSGGSDFHGKAKPDIQPGSGYGNLKIPYHVYEDLISYWQQKYNLAM